MNTYNFHNIIDDVLNNSFNELFDMNYTNQVPSANIIEEDDQFIIELFSPGLTKEDFHITVDKLQLTVSSSAKEEHDKPTLEGKLIAKEFDYSNFKRSFTLSNTIDTDNIKATYDNGILSVSIGKKEEAKEKGPQFINID